MILQPHEFCMFHLMVNISLPGNLLATNMTLQPHESCMFHLMVNISLPGNLLATNMTCFISLPDNLLITNMALHPHVFCVFHLLTWQSADHKHGTPSPWVLLFYLLTWQPADHKHGTPAPWVLYVSSPYLAVCWPQKWYSSPMSPECFIFLPDNLLTTNMALHPHEFCMFHLLTWQSADHKHGTPSPWVLYVSSPYQTICWPQTWHSIPMSSVCFISLPDNLLTTNMAL